MENTMDLGNTICNYANTAGKLMENYFSDLIRDVEHIKEMVVGDVLYFIIQPNCTHTADESNYNGTRDNCADVWGNYVVIRSEKKDDDQFTIKNWDTLDTKSYDTKNKELIQKYKNFVLG